MQNNQPTLAAVDREITSNHNDASSRVYLSANMTRRLEKLAPWRIDLSLLKFSKLGPNFEGGCAVVSRALLFSLSGDVNDQLMESRIASLATGNRASKSEGNNECREVEGSDEKSKSMNQAAAEEQEHGGDDEASGRQKLVAVKKMKVKTRSDAIKVLGLAIREAEFLVSHSHENIIKLEGFVEDMSKNVIWLIFPWEKNGTLKDFIASEEWEIPERISLANILVNSKCLSVITDFGSAHHPTTKHSSKDTRRANKDPQPAASPQATFCPSTNTITLTCNHYTLRWAAPELLKEDDASLASDIWALGCVAYEVMTNSIPFHDVKDAIVVRRVVRGDLPSVSSDVRMALIQALCTLVGQCWNINPSKRPKAETCLEAIRWMPMITPNPVRATDAASVTGRSAELRMQLGRMHQVQSDYPNASKYFIQALGLYAVISDRAGEAHTLLELAQIHKLQGNRSRAVTAYSDALNIHTEIGNRPGRAIALFGLADVHRLRNEYSQAIASYSKCLNIRTEIGDRQGRASALWGLAEAHRARSEYSQAVTFYSECLEIWTEIGERQGRASALGGLAEVHRLRGEYSLAVTFHSECLQIRTDLGNRLGRAAALWGLAEVHRLRGEYAQAVAFYSDCLQIQNEIGDRRGRAETLCSLADVHRARSEYSQAVTLYSECLNIRTEIGDKQGRATALWGLAEVHRLQREYTPAITFYSEFLQIRTDVADQRGRASALWGLADVHRLRSEYRQAITFYSECLQIRTDSGDRLGRAAALWGLAEVHRARKEHSQAVKLFSEALKISIEIGSIYWKAFILFGIANTHHDQAHYSDAFHHYKQAAEAFQQVGHNHNEAIALERAADAGRLIKQTEAT